MSLTVAFDGFTALVVFLKFAASFALTDTGSPPFSRFVLRGNSDWKTP